MQQRILVWDVPTRLFHWLMVLSFLGAFATGDSERWRDVHVALGYTLSGLIGFRLVWGIVGTRYARFASFAFGPSAVLSYAKSLLQLRPRHFVGHNPAGSWAIFAVLTLGILTVASGYGTYNEIGGEWLEELHEGAANVMLVLAVVHVVGVMATSLLHRENLARSMITGYKSGNGAQGIRHAHWIMGSALALGVLAYWLGLY